MESKKINQLATEMSPAISDLTIIGDPITGVSKKITLLQIADLFQTTGTVTSVAVTESGNALNITGSPITTAGTINIGFAGSANQYVRGDGALAPFPTTTGGGSSVSYYLNGSVNQGTFGGSTYYQMSKDAVIGVGTNFSTSSNGLIAQFITDANDPDVVQIPSGNWNIEFFMNVSASSGALASFYVEIYKYNGSTFTLLATNSATPEELTNTTTVDAYYTSVAMPTSALSVTDRLAIRIYANVASKTVTLYTEDNRLCQVVTTFSKGMSSLNNLTDQSQFLATGTSGTNFAIASSGDTHTFNLPVASATNTGKLSNTDWSTFNNKQNALTNPITGLGASGNVAYFDSASSITSENSFNYDASTNRLGVNTTVPNATIGANAGLDSGYSLLLKNDNANYNSIGFATDSTYGNMITADRVGAAPSRNLTLYNYAGFISLTESGNLGVGLLTPSTGVDIYNSTNAQLWLHNNTSGLGATHGVRLALFTSGNGNLRNFDGGLSMSSEGDFQVITLGAENIRVNSANGFVGIGNPTTLTSLLTVNGAITQSSVLSSLLKTNASGTLVAAVAGTDYVVPSALTGYVPTSRTITINGTTQNLSADISYSVGTITGGGADGRVAYYSGTSGITSDSGFIYESGANRLGVNTVSPNATIGANSPTDSNYSLLLKNSDTNYSGIGFATSSVYGNTIETVRIGTAPSRNLTLYNYAGYVSLTESGNFGVGILTPNTGIDIYNSSISSLWLHTAASGVSSTDGVRLFLSSNTNAVLRNNEGSLSMSSEGDFYIITIGAENFRVNSANGYVGIGNPTTLTSILTVNGSITQSVTSALLKANASGTIIAAVAGTDYVIPSALSGYLPLSGGTLTGTLNGINGNFSGNVGIGTTSPDTKLDVRGEISLSYNANDGLRFWNQDRSNWSSISNTITAPSSSANLIFRTSAGVALTIDPNRNATFTTNISAQQGTFSSSVTATSVEETSSLIQQWSYKGASTAYRLQLNTIVSSGLVKYSFDLTNNSTAYPNNLVLTNGNVGIGTSSPTEGLVVANSALRVTGQATDFGAGSRGVSIDTITSSGNGRIYMVNGTGTAGDLLLGTANTERMRIRSGGAVGIGNAGEDSVKFEVKADGTGALNYAALFLNGSNVELFNVRSDGAGYLKASAWSYGSDKRIKENINYIETGLNKILALKPATFDYIDGVKNNIGWIAQDVEEVIPEAVSVLSETNDQLTLKSDFIVPYLVKAVQEQQAQIEELKALINK